ncbi:ankyrin repeat and SOCS box protein 5b [Aplochiton taeniatus]
MSGIPSKEPERSFKALGKRPLALLPFEEKPDGKKSCWGMLTSQGSWADRSPLHEAAGQGRLLALRTLLLQGYQTNIITIDHVTPLHEACLSDHVACASALILAGANVNATTIDGVTPLFNACSSGSTSCAEVLLRHGAETHFDICQPSALHEASKKGSSDCVEALLSYGADVDYDIPHLGTPLYIACLSQQLVCTRKLLERGASVEMGKNKDSPLHAAAKQDNAELVSLLLNYGADINRRDSQQHRPLEMAPCNGQTEPILLSHEGNRKMRFYF